MAETREISQHNVNLCRNCVRKIARQPGTLPASFLLKGVTKASEHAVEGGGFADVYMGEYGGKAVALKALRIYNKQDQKKVIKLCSFAKLPGLKC